jgi:HEAT repeat protein
MKWITFLCAFAVAFSCSAAEPKPSPAQLEKEAALLQVLQSGADRKAKADACRELAIVGGKASVKPLLALLPDEQLSHMARYALETIPDPGVDKGLREAAATLQGKPLVGVIGSIGVRRDAKAVSILNKHLAGSDPEVVQAAARSLGAIGNSAAAKALQKAWPKAADPNKLALAEGLLRCADQSGSTRTALAICEPLRQCSIPQVRSGATATAILRQGPGNLAILQESLRGQDAAAFSGALKASSALPEMPVTRALEMALSQAPRERLTAIVQALGNRQDPEALVTLSNLARDQASPLRISAINAIGQIGSPRSVPLLVQVQSGPDAASAQAARAALAAIPGPEADKAVFEMLSGANTQTRLTGLELVARRRMTSAMPELLKLTKEGDPRLRAAATRQVGEMGGPAEIPALLDVLLISTEAEQVDAVEYALGVINGKMPNKDAFASQIIRALPRAQPGQKIALLQVLGAAGGPVAYQAVRDTLQDGNQDVRGSALRVLGNWNGLEAAPFLLETAQSSTNATEKTLALRGYLRLASQPELPVKDRLEMCRQAADLAQRPEEKRLLLAALGATRSVQALAPIAACLADPATREEAATAALDIVERQLRDKDAPKDASVLVPALEKIVESGAKEDLVKRAKTALDQAKK